MATKNLPVVKTPLSRMPMRPAKSATGAGPTGSRGYIQPRGAVVKNPLSRMPSAK